MNLKPVILHMKDAPSHHYVGSFKHVAPMRNRFRRIIRLLRRVARLSWGDRWLLARASGLTVAVRGALAVVSFRRLLRFLEQRVPAGGELDAEERRRITWAVEAAGRRLVPERPCLTQAFVAQYMLARRGERTNLRIGVAKGEADDLQAHAWLEIDGGEVVIGGADSPERYEPLPSFSADPQKETPTYPTQS